VVLDREVNPSNVPPFGIADNPYSLIDVADLVFIDPVGTGWSKVVGKGSTADFWGVDEDADTVSQFIELWLTEHKRWNAPKFVMGESYGSVRAAVLPRALMGGPLYMGVMRGITTARAARWRPSTRRCWRSPRASSSTRFGRTRPGP
jgi:carboxypeptidase C (cathepsin A)